jgi:hypothetical protein
MTTLDLTVRFLTPAFLGDAEQSGRWRTPPAQLHRGISSVERNTA